MRRTFPGGRARAFGARPHLPRLLVALLAVEGVAVIVLWVGSLWAGAFPDGVFAYQLEGAIPIFHLLAEFGMAAAVLVGVAGWFAGARWSGPIVMFAAGMLTYGSVNALGWALHNDAVLAIPMGITLVTVVWLIVVRVRRGAIACRVQRGLAPDDDGRG